VATGWYRLAVVNDENVVLGKALVTRRRVEQKVRPPTINHKNLLEPISSAKLVGCYYHGARRARCVSRSNIALSVFRISCRPSLEMQESVLGNRPDQPLSLTFPSCLGTLRLNTSTYRTQFCSIMPSYIHPISMSVNMSSVAIINSIQCWPPPEAAQMISNGFSRASY
jgi:hypothetical protein